MRIIQAFTGCIDKGSAEMKNVFKKAAAAVMAFTLLGVGTTFTSNVSSNKNVLTATAAKAAKIKCTCHGQYVWHDTLSFSYDKLKTEVVSGPCYRYEIQYTVHVVSKYDVTYCRACGETVKRTQTYYHESRI